MFFIARCLFWFIVIFMHLPEGEQAGVSPGRFLDMAGVHVDAIARQQAGTLAVHAAEMGAAWCQAHGEACADAVLAAMALNAPADVTVKRPGAPKPTAAKVASRG